MKFIILYLILDIMFTQMYKKATFKMEKAGALTILLEWIGCLFCLLLIPFFQWKLPNDIHVYFFLFLAILFYTVNDRLGTTVRSGVDASSYSILKQLSTVFMIVMGITFFKEPISILKLIGVTLIILSNILVFYEKGQLKLNKYVWLGILANLSYTIALFIDVNNSNEFCLPFYVFISLATPSILILLFEKIKLKEIKNEWKRGNKKAIVLTSFAWGTMIISQLRAYQLESVVLVATLCSISVILNAIFGYVFLKEKDKMVQKIVAGIVIIIGIFLIKL